jgi:hypothetical protein
MIVNRLRATEPRLRPSSQLSLAPWRAMRCARQSPAEPAVAEQELAARVAAIAERIRSAEPTLVRELPPEVKIAQWRNR